MNRWDTHNPATLLARAGAWPLLFLRGMDRLAPTYRKQLTHLSKLAVEAGQHVKRGQLLGYSGSANGAPHLHLGVEHGDPQKLFGV